MENSRDTYLIDPLANSSEIRRVLFWLSLLILGGQALIFLLFLLNRETSREAVIMAVSLLATGVAFILNQRWHVQEAGAVVAINLVILVTVLATVGQGTFDTGVMAYPAILIIASLILRRNTIYFLTLLILACNGWLVFGGVYNYYEPVLTGQSDIRQFIVITIIIITTMSTALLISKTVRHSLTATRIELMERQKAEQALRKAETMYKALVEKTSVIIYRDAPVAAGNTLYISPQIEALLGYPVNEWLETPTSWQNFVHPEDLTRVLAEVERYLTSGEKAVIEYRMRTKDGRWLWFRDESVVIPDEDGKPQYVQGVLIDITERKLAEWKVQQREAIIGAVAQTAQQLLKSTDWREEINSILSVLGEATGASHVYIFENHPGVDGVMLSSQRYEWAAPGMRSELDNPAYQNARLVPVVPGLEEWYANLSLGKPFYGSASQYPRYWREVFEEPGLKTLLDVPIFVNDEWWGIIGFDDYVNEMPWSQVEINALMAAAGNLGTAISRQQTDAALRASEEKFQLAFHRTFVPMTISRAKDQVILDVNNAFCQGTGYSRTEAIGRTASDLNLWVRQEDRLRHQQILAEHGYAEDFKAPFRRKSGEIGVALISAITILLENEVCLLHTMYDISKIEDLLNKLKATNDELQNFTYTVSHDLKAPLVTISGFLGYLEQDMQKGDTVRFRRDLERIQDAVTRMQKLLNELLELSRIGRLMNPPEQVSFGEIVREALQVVEGRLSANNVEAQIDPELPTITGDRARLVEVVQNLVDNAAKFMGEQPNPKIEIGVKMDERGQSVFHVRDNGIGIEPEFQDKVFGLFNKLDPHTEGTGLGLALAKRIIEVHGGRIWLESEGRGRGTTFFFTLAEQPAAPKE